MDIKADLKGSHSDVGKTGVLWQPAFNQGAGLLGIVLVDVARHTLNFGHHRCIAQQVSHFKFGVAGLTCAQQFTRSANLQIELGNNKAVITVA